MGKQSRRKKRTSNEHQPISNPNTPSTPPPHESSSPPPSSSNLISRLRHSSPEIRNAALSALSHTLFAPLPNNNKKPNDEILQCLLERVMDENTSVARNAIGCLNNFIVFGSQNELKRLFTKGNDVALILITRLENSIHRVDVVDSSTTEAEWEVASICFQTLSGLVESSSSLTMERLFSSSKQNTRLVDLVLRVFSRSGDKTVDAAKSRVVFRHAAQTLHSLLDDNFSLAQYLSTQNAFTSIISMLQRPPGSTDWLIPEARLHLCGILITARQLLTPTIIPDDVICQTVVPTLMSCIEWDLPTIRTATECLVTAWQKLRDNENDHAMEREVVKMVEERKEPARLIARRQKEAKAKKRQNESMEMDGAVTAGAATAGAAPGGDDVEDDYERALEGWKGKVLPLKLALEITTNLCAGSSADGNDEEGEDEMMMWESDDEDKMESMATNNNNNMTTPFFHSDAEKTLFQSISSSPLPDKVFHLFKTLHITSPTTLHDASSPPLPPIIADDILDLQSKTSACLINIATNLTSWHDTTPSEILSLWNEILPFVSKPGVSTVLLSFLRSRPTLQTSIQSTHFDVLLRLCHSSIPQIQQDGITMLSILAVRQPHSSHMYESISSTLLPLLRVDDGRIVNEVLNAFMDMYAEDDAHPEVFWKLKILEEMEGVVLPKFKKLVNRNGKEKVEEEEWKETLLNVGRFVTYKKERR